MKLSTLISSYFSWSKMSYYAVAKGRQPGIYTSWGECSAQVLKYPGAIYKKFGTEKQAANFIDQNGGSSSTVFKENVPFSYGCSKSNTGTSVKRRFENRQISSSSSDEDLVVNLPKRRYLGTDKNYTVDEDGYVNVYTDGACSRNGGNNAAAGIGVWFGDDHPMNVSQPVIGRATNNMAEIQAVTIAAKKAHEAGIKKLKINTDSKFLIQCINNWMPKWKRNNWKTAEGKPVINKVELLEAEKALSSLDAKLNHVRGHRGLHGNEMADKLARDGCAKYK